MDTNKPKLENIITSRVESQESTNRKSSESKIEISPEEPKIPDVKGKELPKHPKAPEKPKTTPEEENKKADIGIKPPAEEKTSDTTEPVIDKIDKPELSLAELEGQVSINT